MTQKSGEEPFNYLFNLYLGENFFSSAFKVLLEVKDRSKSHAS
jgi:hypothetical protein